MLWTENASAVSGHNIADSLSCRCCHDSVAPEALPVAVDSVGAADSTAFSRMPWYRQLIDNGFRINDPQVRYPRFPRFLLSIYNWGDRTFNSYDPEYVVGVGKNWKITAKSYNWMESYMMLFSLKTRDMLHISSNIYNDVGVHLSFMALSVGYTAKLNNFISGGKAKRENLNFNFTCSRIYANIDFSSTAGNTRITHFGAYRGDCLPYDYDDIEHKSLSGEAFYIFNYNRYSHAAAYCFSKYQLRSSGSWLLGFAFANQNMRFSFLRLPDEMKPYLPDLEDVYHYRYTDYDLCGGYAHNWVIKPRTWLLNLTFYPAAGYRYSFKNSTDNKRHLLAASAHARFSAVYNHKALFVSLTGRFDGHLYFNSRYTFFNSMESLSLIMGARF
ncbi:MAG: DUF4421 domain-containing protein, partial [Paramuribaculum sp.]|nr:DUF4421 domain-containing protein [Paramuribaculum sp.]